EPIGRAAMGGVEGQGRGKARVGTLAFVLAVAAAGGAGAGRVAGGATGPGRAGRAAGPGRAASCFALGRGRGRCAGAARRGGVGRHGHAVVAAVVDVAIGAVRSGGGRRGNLVDGHRLGGDVARRLRRRRPVAAVGRGRRPPGGHLVLVLPGLVDGPDVVRGVTRDGLRGPPLPVPHLLLNQVGHVRFGVGRPGDVDPGGARVEGGVHPGRGGDVVVDPHLPQAGRVGVGV